MNEAANPGIVFWVLSAIILVTGFMVVSLKNIFHCAIALVLCLSGVAGIFVLLGAEFLAGAQVLIYVGAVAILMIFGVMLTSNLAGKKIIATTSNAMVAFFATVLFGGGTIVTIFMTDVWRYSSESLPIDNVMFIGKLLMTEFMLPFEVVSVLLLAAMIGAIVLARDEES